MTVKEVFEIWKKDRFKGDLCRNGVVEGYMCGFFGFGNCKVYEDVRYGCTACPKNCEAFVMADDSELWSRFKIYYHNSADLYNKKYSIDKNDPNYWKGYDEINEEYERRNLQRNLECAESLAKSGLLNIESIIEEGY